MKISNMISKLNFGHLAAAGSCWKPTLSRFRGHLPKNDHICHMQRNDHVCQLQGFWGDNLNWTYKLDFGHLAAARSCWKLTCSMFGVHIPNSDHESYVN